MNTAPIAHDEELPVFGGPADGSTRRVSRFMPDIFPDGPIAYFTWDGAVYECNEAKRRFEQVGRVVGDGIVIERPLS